tara:strand:+ start:12784 stop:13341 length:558 start_codon:yes stop_codon:yes gene_type:complete
MSVIYPGNYVAHLNAYKGQGVEALPGVEFYKAIGVYTATSTVSSGTLALVVQSPDQRGDDKPRLDKNFVIPAGATIYRTAVGVYNLKSTGSATIQATGISGGVTLTASSGAFDENGAASAFDLSGSLSALGSATAVTAAASANLELVDVNSIGAVLVEVCYYVDAPAPSSDDVHLPYKIEAGQSA